MIFVSLGTHEQPFVRALDTVTPLAAREEELVIQHGHTPPRTDLRAKWIEFAAYDEIVDLLKRADVVVCHAGVGTIMSTLGVGKCPVVLPRLARFGEHVDDHQLQITTAFAAREIVVACLQEDDIADCIQRARLLAGRQFTRRGDLTAAVAAATAGADEQTAVGARPRWNS